MLVSLWFDTEWFFYVTFIDVSANDTLTHIGVTGSRTKM